MRKVLFLLALGAVFVAFAEQAHADNYRYDRSSTGCAKGDCLNGYGAYVFLDDDIYEGNWKAGKMHGYGTFYIVDGGPWPDAHRLSGQWKEGKMHGKFTYTYPSGTSKVQYWYDDNDVTSTVDNCRTATSVSGAYQGFVAIVNGLFAAAEGRDVAESAAWGYEAAGDQLLPKAVDLTCDQLLAELE